ncbi:Protein of unknown function [Cotesia congregata]|uniref:Tyr recombinase domain-containing protein n=1 Tax=Cotesia congregata TaxID=51543 RepID=A0A8J2HQU7_COTCN|nr:Protein of unknown function [Cotesia congregata]
MYQKNAYQRPNASTSPQPPSFEETINVSKSAGRLSLFKDIWALITSDLIVLTWISGYEIPFSQFARQNTTPTESKVCSRLRENRWWLICNQQEIPRYLFNITHILNFLTQEFNRDASYGSINSYKSALSLLLGAEVRQDARIKRFCKSIANIRPPKRKYNGTWDPDVVLKLLNQWPENGDLSLKRLSFKLVILLALTTGHRMQTFSLINVLDVQKQREAIVIKIPATIKTSGPRQAQPTPYITI